MNRKFVLFTAAMFLVVLGISACSTIIPQTGGLSQEERIATQNAQIVNSALATATYSGMQTQIAQLQTEVARPTAIGGQIETAATATTAPSVVAPSATPLPSVTPLPSFTPVPPTSTPLPTATPLPCNAAQFVGDVTIADGSTISAGSGFNKIWRLKNTGACTWTTSYDLVFVSGDSMGATAVDFPINVGPGQTVDVSAYLTAPSAAGSYRGNWKIRDAGGYVFGIGASSNPFYVDIKVVAPTSNYPLDFVASACLAQWSSGAGDLPCPGLDTDTRGYVRIVEKPTLETGYIDDEPALLMHPQMVNDGIIRGKYPSMRVENGHHFVAIIGCARSSNGCDVKFQLDYQIGNGSITTLKTWSELYDEMFATVDVDVSSLAGQDVKFILTILSNGSSSNDKAQWLAPRIVKK